MTTRWRQKASSLLAIVGVIALLLLIIFLWTAVKNGVFSTHNTSVYNKINISDNSEFNLHRASKISNNGKFIFLFIINFTFLNSANSALQLLDEHFFFY